VGYRYLHNAGDDPRRTADGRFVATWLLLVRDPEGHWHYDDNGWGRNPLIDELARTTEVMHELAAR
jgi:hypothetical protein